MRDGPRREQGCFLRRFGAAGECPPRPYPPERIAPWSGLGALGVDGGGGVADWAKAAPALEAPDYRRTKASTLPQVGCLFPGVGLRAAQCLWAAGVAHLGEGIGRRGMLRPVHRWAAGGQGGRCPVRKPALASRFGWRAWPRRAEGPLSQLLGVGPCSRRWGLPLTRFGGRLAAPSPRHPVRGVWLTVPRL